MADPPDLTELHPENALDVLVNFPRAMALGASGKELPNMRVLHGSKDELVTPTATAGAGRSMHISPNGSYLSLLLVHGSLRKDRTSLS
jgi:hypothetical protein